MMKFRMNEVRLGLFSLIALLLSAILPSQAATTMEEVEFDQSLDSKLVTPHKPWAKNYQPGQVKALYFVSPGSYSGKWFAPDTRLRDVVELHQRFNIKGDAVFFGGSDRKGGDFLGMELGRARAEKLLEQDYDVYVIAAVALNRLPPDIQFKILEKVCRSGKGLVIINNSGSKDFMLPKREIKPTPAQLVDGLPAIEGVKPAAQTKAYSFAKGRAVWINYSAWCLTRSLDYSKERFNEYDYQMMQVGRAVLWAAKKDARVNITSEAAARADGMPEPVFTLTADKELLANVEIEWRRISDNWRIASTVKNVQINPAGAKITAQFPMEDQKDGLPATKAGRYFVDIKVTSSQGDEAYGAIDATVESKVKLEDMVVVQSWVEPEAPQQVTANIYNNPIPAGAKITWRLFDCWGRVLLSKEAEARGFNTWNFMTPKHATIGMRIQAALTIGGREISVIEDSYTVSKRQRGHFGFLQWDTPVGVLGPIGWKQLREAGHKLCLVGSFGESKRNNILAESDISLVPYSTRILADKDENGTMKPMCWNCDPEADLYVKRIVSRQQFRRQQGVYCYSLGDEGVTEGCCTHPACIKEYQEYLKLQYKTIDALNASWGEKYKDFSEVALLEPTDNYESMALSQKKNSRWYDRQAFARWNLMQFSKRFVEQYKVLDEKAVTGFEGTGGFGDDIALISSINTFYSPYPSIGDDILRSIADRSLMRANWMGYSKTGDALSDAAWRMVMKEMDSIWYWMWTGVGAWIGYITPTLDFHPATLDLKNEMKPVRDGLGDLLINLKVKHSGIAILYTLPSALSGKLENGANYVTPINAHECWARFIYQLGYDFKYVGKDQLLRGDLLKGFKVLLMPNCQALSNEECAAIKAFADAGGTVVADTRPAIFDEHCNIRTTPALDSLFGVKRTGLPVSVKANLEGLMISNAIVDPGITLAGGTAGEFFENTENGKTTSIPLVISNTCGRGKAILLNFQFPKGKNLNDVEDGVEKIALRIFDKAGVDSDALLRAPDGSPISFTETRIWENGDSMVVGAWWQMQNAWFSPTDKTLAAPPQKARITLKQKAYVYDLRSGKFLGKLDAIDTTLKQGRANFFLVQNFKTKKVKIDLEEKPARGNLVKVNLTTSIPKGAHTTQAVKVEIVSPNGCSPEWASQIVLLKDGKGTCDFHVAHNDMPGKWTVKATELFSGISNEKTWKLK